MGVPGHGGVAPPKSARSLFGDLQRSPDAIRQHVKAITWPRQIFRSRVGTTVDIDLDSGNISYFDGISASIRVSQGLSCPASASVSSKNLVCLRTHRQ
jgi:hypothetical protein